ncbi:MAG: hypothetical protein Greene041662_982, partial [Candidatus Peregrinibacteria bacterium Greene0416_62]
GKPFVHIHGAEQRLVEPGLELVCDDHPATRKGVKQILSDESIDVDVFLSMTNEELKNIFRATFGCKKRGYDTFIFHCPFAVHRHCVWRRGSGNRCIVCASACCTLNVKERRGMVKLRSSHREHYLHLHPIPLRRPSRLKTDRLNIHHLHRPEPYICESCCKCRLKESSGISKK